MILPVIIDTTQIMQEYTSLSKSDVENMLDNIAKQLTARYAQKLEQVASRELHQTRQRYIRNIKVVDSGKMEGTVLLDYSKDPVIRMIEEGASPFDMKVGFMRSSKVKIGKNGGKYLTIPYRWAVSTSLGESDVFSGQLPKEIYNIVRKKVTNIPVSGGGRRSEGLKFNELPKEFQKKEKRAEIVDSKGNVLFKAYENKAPLFQGLTKQTDLVTGQNRYFSFRRVSEKTDINAWIHPGIERKELVQKALSEFNVPEELGNAIDNELTKRGLI